MKTPIWDRMTTNSLNPPPLTRRASANEAEKGSKTYAYRRKAIRRKNLGRSTEEEVPGEYCCRMMTQAGHRGDKPAWIGTEEVRIPTEAEFDSGASKTIVSETTVIKLRELQEVTSEKIVPMRAPAGAPGVPRPRR
eukprot:GHVU01136250.1.p1 GENE.GHVU01136250.1~~GHVU01136250.1.p1  ORF type:complete len:155 (+),score=20.56 GHVU01136250.1:58-465(+)